MKAEIEHFARGEAIAVEVGEIERALGSLWQQASSTGETVAVSRATLWNVVIAGPRPDRAGRDQTARRRDRARAADAHDDALPRRRTQRERSGSDHREQRRVAAGRRADGLLGGDHDRRAAQRPGALRRAGARAAGRRRADRDVLARSRRARIAARARAACPSPAAWCSTRPPACIPSSCSTSSGSRPPRSRCRWPISAGCGWAPCARCSPACSIRRSAARRSSTRDGSRSSTAPAATRAPCCCWRGSACCSAGARCARPRPRTAVSDLISPAAGQPVSGHLVPADRPCGRSGILCVELAVGQGRDDERYAFRRTAIDQAVLQTPGVPAKPVKLDSPSDAELAVAALGARGRDPLFVRCLSYARQLWSLETETAGSRR